MLWHEVILIYLIWVNTLSDLAICMHVKSSDSQAIALSFLIRVPPSNVLSFTFIPGGWRGGWRVLPKNSRKTQVGIELPTFSGGIILLHLIWWSFATDVTCAPPLWAHSEVDFVCHWAMFGINEQSLKLQLEFSHPTDLRLYPNIRGHSSSYCTDTGPKFFVSQCEATMPCRNKSWNAFILTLNEGNLLIYWSIHWLEMSDCWMTSMTLSTSIATGIIN